MAVDVIEELAKAMHAARERHRVRPAFWEEQFLSYRLMMRERAVDVLATLDSANLELTQQTEKVLR